MNRLNRVRLPLRAQNTVPIFVGLVLVWAAGLPGLAELGRIESSSYRAVADSPDEGPTIARIRRRGYVIVGIQTQVRPLSFGPEPQGLEIELAQQLALGLLGQASAVRFVPLLHRDRLPAIQDGRVDLVIAGLTRTNARQRLIRMTAPYYFDGLGVIVPKSGTGSRLGSGPIAVLQGSEAIAVTKTRWPRATLVAVESYAAAYQALESGQAQAFVGDRSVLIGWQQEFPQYRCLDDRLSSAPLAIGLAKGQDDLALALERQLVQLGPWLKAAAQRWGLP